MKLLVLILFFAFCATPSSATQTTIIGTGHSLHESNKDAAKRIPNRPFLVLKAKSYKISSKTFVTEITIWKD